MIPIAIAAALVAGCGSRETGRALPWDLTRDLAGARIQPAPTAEVARAGEVTDAAGSTPALIVAAPARLTWQARFPEHAEIEGSVALLGGPSAPEPAPAGVLVRIGISDARAFEELVRVTLTPRGDRLAWQPLRVDLGSYSGWKWSLFYQPSRITWNLILAVDPAPGGTVALKQLVVRKHGVSQSR
jgi:hypothetical protein